MEQLKLYFELAAQAIFGLVIFATVVVRLTPNHADDKALDAFLQKFHKALSFFPTFGMNPKTKELQDWYEKEHGPKNS